MKFAKALASGAPLPGEKKSTKTSNTAATSAKKPASNTPVKKPAVKKKA